MMSQWHSPQSPPARTLPFISQVIINQVLMTIKTVTTRMKMVIFFAWVGTTLSEIFLFNFVLTFDDRHLLIPHIEEGEGEGEGMSESAYRKLLAGAPGGDGKSIVSYFYPMLAGPQLFVIFSLTIRLINLIIVSDFIALPSSQRKNLRMRSVLRSSAPMMRMTRMMRRRKLSMRHSSL